MRSSKILSVLVENKPGTLYKVIHLVRLMRLNIEGLTLGVTGGGDTCRLTLTLNGDDATVEHVSKQLMKVIDVLDAHTYAPAEVTARELALVRIRSDEKSTADEWKPFPVVSSYDDSVVVEVVGNADEIDEFVHRVGDSRVMDIARTGVAALPREIQIG